MFRKVGRSGIVQYFVKWKNLGYEESTWETEDKGITLMKEEIQKYKDHK